LRKAGPRVKRQADGARNSGAERKNLNICKPQRDIGTEKTGLAVKKERHQPKREAK